MTTLARALSLPLALVGLALPAQVSRQTPARSIEATADALGSFEFDEAWHEVVAAFREDCERHGVVGASLMFLRGREVLGFETFGMADRAGSRAVDADTIYHWASITKTFTGIAAMQLRDRGQIGLEQPIVEFVPELREVHDPYGAIDAITLRHLLSHSAGFRGPTWPWSGGESWHPHEPTRFAQLVAMMPYTEIEFAPGNRYSYSNPGIVFVGRTIETVSGDDYEVYMDKNVLRPLGMTHAYFDVTPYHLQRFRSHSYATRDGEVEDLGPDFDTGVTVSNGGLNAPLTDMARYLTFLLGACEADSDASRVLSRESLGEMWQPIVPTRADGSVHMGLTFFVTGDGPDVFITHTGTQRSFLSFFYVHPASNTAAIGAFNTDAAAPIRIRLRDLCMERLSTPLTGR